MSNSLDVYKLVSEQAGSWLPESLLSHALVLVVLVLVGYRYRAQTLATLDRGELTAGPQLSLFALVDFLMESVHSLALEHCHKRAREFFPLLASFFLVILVGNLSGLIPGLPPFTENFSANLALGFIAFIAYNYAGIAEHGWGYISQFTGPFLVLAPLFLLIEVVSHAVRPLSLAFRLLANVFCDHLLLKVFAGLVPFGVPVFFLFFGLLVAVIQSFVFTLLTGIYINMATSHDH